MKYEITNCNDCVRSKALPEPAERRLRVGLIGLGEVGRTHLAAYADARRVTVAAIAEPAAERWPAGGPPCFPSAKAMMAETPLDLVCVLTPPSGHEALTLAAAARGLHVLCEKPLALDEAACRRMIDGCARAGVRLAYGASYRHLPALIAARALIRAGAVGRVRVLQESVLGGAPRVQPLPASHYPDGGPGGTPMGLMDHGAHLTDLFAWLMDSPAVAAFGAGNRTGAPPAPEHLTLRFANGAVGALLYDEGVFAAELPWEGQFSWGASWGPGGYAPGGGWDAYPGCVRIYGDAGALRVFHYANTVYLSDARGVRQVPVEGQPAPAHFAAQIDAFAREIIEDLPPACPGEAGLAALRPLLAAYADGVVELGQTA